MSNYTKSTNFATKDNLTPGDPLKIVRGTEIDTEFNNISTAIATKTDNSAAAITGGTIDGATVGATTPATGAFTTLAASGTTTLAGALVGAATQSAFNTVSTTLNLGGAATALNLGAATGTATVNNTTLAAKAITASTTLAVTGTSTLTGAVTATAGVSGPITSSSVSITGGSITGITDLAVADGGTGASTAAGGLNNLLPSQTGNASKYLQTDGTNASWDAVSLSTADITGTLGAANGGTGVSNNAAMTVTGSGNFAYTRTLTGTTNVTFPTTGTLATLAGTETLTNKTLTSPILTTPTLGVATGTSFQGIIGNVTPAAGSFTTLGASSTATLNTLSSSGATLTGGTINGMTVGATTPSSGAFTTVTASTAIGTASGGTGLGGATPFTSGGVVYASSTSALATGSALTFDGTQFGVSGNVKISNTANPYLQLFDGTRSGYIQIAAGALNLIQTTAQPITFSTNNTERLVIDSAGNLGLGVTPSAWLSSIRALQVNNAGMSLFTYSASASVDQYAFLTNNSFQNSSVQDIYVRTNPAAQYRQLNATHAWFNAPSGTAGNPITFTQAMTLDASGQLGVGVTSINQTGAGSARVVSIGGTAQAFVEYIGTTGSGNSTGSLHRNASALIGGIVVENATGNQGIIEFSTNNGTTYAERARIDSSGNVGINTTTPSTYGKLAVNGSIYGIGGNALGVGNSDNTNFSYLINSGSTGANNANMTFNMTNKGELMRLTSDGNLLVGTTTTTNNLRLNEKFAIVHAGSNTYAGMAITGYSGTGGGARPLFEMQRSRGTTDGSLTKVESDDVIGSLIFRGSDGSAFRDVAEISVSIDGATGASDVPGRITFSTSADGSSSPTERARIDSSGNLLVGTTSSANNARITVQADSDTFSNVGLSIAYSSSLFRQLYLTNTGTVLQFNNGSNQANLSAAGAWTNASDARLKKNIVEIKYGLATVLNTQPRSFERKDVAGEYIGFVAQELKQIIPEVVFGSDEEKDQYTVDYGSMVAIAFKAIQELKAEFDAYKASHP